MNSRSAEQQKPRKSFFGHLLRSHMSVALIGVFSLLIALTTLFLQVKNAELLSSRVIPIAQASAQVSHGVEHSLATMRGWVSLNDKGFVNDWNKVWEENISPAVDELTQLSQGLKLPGNKKRMAELFLLLAELKESQWWVLEIAQTPGNEPARVMHQFETEPILLTLDTIIRTLLDAEKGQLSVALHDAERNSLHDVAIYYYSVRELLQKIIFRGYVSLEDQYLQNLQILKMAVDDLLQIKSHDDRFDSLMLHFKKELAALERISLDSIAIRKSNSWNISRHLMATETVPLARKVINVMGQISRETGELVARQASLTTRRGFFAAIGLSGLLFVMLVSAFLLSRNRAAALSHPVIVLANAARDMAAGTLTEDIPMATNDELGDLTRSFNTMRRDLQKSQQKMISQEKMAAIGQLSGSVAHDIRNPLGAISNSIYFLQLITDEETDDKIREHLSIMDSEINRANEIINDLLDFSRENVPTFVIGDFTEFLLQIVSGFDFTADIGLELQLDKELPMIAFDSSQMQRVLSNLILNARQAMPDGGSLQIRTGYDDEYVWFAITDNGYGIAEETLDSIFEPLFTTKASGVGLGLSIVKDFIDKHHGRIEVESMLEQGTTFTTRLPIMQKTEQAVDLSA